MSKAKKTEDKDNSVYVSCGNVFEDLGLPNAEMLLLKADLGVRVMQIIEERKLRNKDVAAVWKVDPAEVSHILNGRFHKYSVERLCKFLLALGDDIEVVSRPKPKSRAKAEISGRCYAPVKKIAPAERAQLKPQHKTKPAAKPKKQPAPKRKAA